MARFAPTLPPHTGGSFSPGVHGARGLFAFFVVVYHAANSGLPVWDMPEVAHQGFLSLKYGVELFFAISGFVIIGTLSRARTAWQFLLNRATRIYSVLWVLLLIFVPLGLLFGRERVVGFSGTELVLVFIGNMFTLGPLLPIPVLYGPAWTLCFEFAFYALCFLYLAGRQYFRIDLRIPLVFLGAWVIATEPRALFFVSGVIVASGVLNRPFLEKLAVEPLVWVVVFLTLWQMGSAEKAPFFPPMYAWDWAQWARGIGAFIAATLAILGIAQGRGLFGRFLQTAPLMWLGTISYSLYLWHLMPMAIIKAAMYKFGVDDLAGGGSQLLLLLLTIPPALVMAALSQYFLENRLATWVRRRLGGRREKAPTTARPAMAE
jgi:exopolysaccharide production protein ExoZ